MNNQFNTANLASQHSIQMAQHVATSPPQTSAAVLNTFFNAQQQQQQQQLAAAVAAGTLYTDPRQIQLNSNPIEKNYYATSGGTTLGTLGSSPRFYTTAGPATAGTNPTVTSTGAHHPNTILITNNFAHQQPQQQLSPEQQRNIRIATSAANHLNAATTANLATPAGGYQHAQHVFNLNNNKQLQHLFPQHLLHQQSYQPTTDLLQQHFATQQFPTTHQQNTTAATTLHMPQFYVSSENTVPQLTSNPKIITNIASNSVSSGGINSNTALVSAVSNNNPSNSSTVVLDRINICINNLYADTSCSSSASNSLASTPAQQPSPIIPAIQHKTIIENGPVLSMSDMYETNPLVIDEPDSTTTATTPHTPPTTPENTPPSMPNIGNTNDHNNSNNNNTITTTSSINSPSTSSNQNLLEKSNNITTTKQNFASVAQNIEELKNYAQTSSINLISPPTQTKHSIPTSNTPITPPTPPSPEISTNKEYLKESKNQTTTSPPPLTLPPLFTCGEDVFIKRQDGRFYLGTVIDNARNQFLIRFDDKTELWCEAAEMRKLGGSSNNNNNKTSSSTEDKIVEQPMCVACKRSQPDSKVEICERCGRGYHRKCTTETSPGSQVWLCKRCAKPMKLNETLKFSSAEEETEIETCLQLPYDVDSLTWDDKHRVNEEQIYCYCGKSGKFDYNMLQCCRCSNWYHTHCTQKVKCRLMRGDGFFVFCCSVCNYGEEYLRRLQLNWVDLVHLILYNLSTMKKHQHHKYHHLLKDINPFALEKRKSLPIPKEWICMTEKEFLDKIKRTLQETTDRFICGKEIKRDHYLFALRTMGPPIINRIPIKPHDTLNDDFILHDLKLKLLPDAAENSDIKLTNFCLNSLDSTPKSKIKLNNDSRSHDVYEFDDTSEDEVPIKHILNKVKKIIMSTLTEQPADDEGSKNSTIGTLEKMDVEDDNANDIIITQPTEQTISNVSIPESEKILIPQKETTIPSPSVKPILLTNNEEEEVFQKSLIVKQTEKSSRKRKAFTLSKSYDAQRLFDSSSDENSSSSSRGTSLDLIIPPPKNFLGQNNPFSVISPKKNTETLATTSSGKKSVSFRIFNTTALNFSSKLAALKSAGLFSKRSTSNLAKAAGQPRTVRTIKRRLSAKDITIGPNQEVRRKRTKRLSSNIEIISTTTINPIPTNFFPIHAKDLLAAAAASTSTAASLFTSTQTTTTPSSLINNSIASASSTINATLSNTDNAAAPKIETEPLLPSHGRRLRQRPQKILPNTSRRSSVSSSQSSNSSTSATMAAAAAAAVAPQNTTLQQSHEDLKQTVNKYFGIVNRIESGEQFSIRAKRQLSNGQMQYLIEWGDCQNGTSSMIKSQEVTSIKDTDIINPNTTIETNTRVDNISQPKEAVIT